MFRCGQEDFRGPCRQLTLTSLHLLAVLRHVVWSDGPEELDVVITVVLGHVVIVGFVWPLQTKHI